MYVWVKAAIVGIVHTHHRTGKGHPVVKIYTSGNSRGYLTVNDSAAARTADRFRPVRPNEPVLVTMLMHVTRRGASKRVVAIRRREVA